MEKSSVPIGILPLDPPSLPDHYLYLSGVTERWRNPPSKETELLLSPSKAFNRLEHYLYCTCRRGLGLNQLEEAAVVTPNLCLSFAE